ncbi:hypothetical protein StoSoilB13_25660 [Arthrobacter sp. StoSoilB13]|nr:hypothetical protein StoSoilB13_25660 [Arthrobacter sp. StoSoilB13]
MLIGNPVTPGDVEHFQPRNYAVQVSLRGGDVVHIHGAGVGSEADKRGAVVVDVLRLDEVQCTCLRAKSDEPFLPALGP